MWSKEFALPYSKMIIDDEEPSKKVCVLLIVVFIFFCMTKKNIKKKEVFCNFSAFDGVKQTKINQIKKRQKYETGIVVDDKRTGADIV